MVRKDQWAIHLDLMIKMIEASWIIAIAKFDPNRIILRNILINVICDTSFANSDINIRNEGAYNHFLNLRFLENLSINVSILGIVQYSAITAAL